MDEGVTSEYAVEMVTEKVMNVDVKKLRTRRAEADVKPTNIHFGLLPNPLEYDPACSSV